VSEECADWFNWVTSRGALGLTIVYVTADLILAIRVVVLTLKRGHSAGGK
jgi:hypothetical protein